MTRLPAESMTDYTSGNPVLPSPRELMVDLYSRRNARPYLDIFPDIFEEDVRAQHIARVRREWQRIGDDRNPARSGNLLENFLRAELEAADWFGASVFQTTDYDDLFHGVDAVAEWEDASHIVVLAVDFTGAMNQSIISRKLSSCARRGAKISYFESDFEAGQRSLYNVPKVILGIDPTFINEIAQTVFEARVLRGEVMDRYWGIERGTFGMHPIRFLLLEQAIAQLLVGLGREMIPALSAKFGRKKTREMRAIGHLLCDNVRSETLVQFTQALRVFDIDAFHEAAGQRQGTVGRRQLRCLEKLIPAFERNEQVLGEDPELVQEVEQWKASSRIHPMLTPVLFRDA